MLLLLLLEGEQEIDWEVGRDKKDVVLQTWDLGFASSSGKSLDLKTFSYYTLRTNTNIY